MMIELEISEHLARGKELADKLFQSEWGNTPAEWYDHRLGLLDPEKWFLEREVVSASNLISVLPLQSRLLDLCCGDGFFDRYLFSRRCSEIVAVDHDVKHAREVHSADNIKYVESDIMEYEPEGLFDAVFMRSAIEHFDELDQYKILNRIVKFLSPQGWFVGDTPLFKTSFVWHKHEWDSEDTARNVLSKVFSRVETQVLEETERKTVYWKCQAS